MSQVFPRRRDVRDMCEELLHALLANVSYDDETEFDRDFLTDVRDAMREGVPFAEAVLFHVPDVADPMDDEDVSDLFQRAKHALQPPQHLIEAMRAAGLSYP